MLCRVMLCRLVLVQVVVVVVVVVLLLRLVVLVLILALMLVVLVRILVLVPVLVQLVVQLVVLPVLVLILVQLVVRVLLAAALAWMPLCCLRLPSLPPPVQGLAALLRRPYPLQLPLALQGRMWLRGSLRKPRSVYSLSAASAPHKKRWTQRRLRVWNLAATWMMAPWILRLTASQWPHPAHPPAHRPKG